MTPDELASALSAAGVSADRDGIHRGVTDRTQQQVARILDTRLDTVVEYNGSVVETTPTHVSLSVSPAPPDALLTRLVAPGQVELVARNPDGERVQLATNTDFARLGQLQQTSGGAQFPVLFTETGTQQVADGLQRLGHTTEGVANCQGQPDPSASGHCYEVVLDGESLLAVGVSEQAAEYVESGQFAEQRQFRLAFPNVTDAQNVRLALLAPPLPTNVSVANGTSATNESTGSPTPTTTPTDGPTDTGTATPAENGPGFSVLGVLVAIVVGGTLVRWRR